MAKVRNRSGLERQLYANTGKFPDEWARIARSAPQKEPLATVKWLRAEHRISLEDAKMIVALASDGGN